MTTNRSATFRMNREEIDDAISQQQQSNLDNFIRQPTDALVRGPIRVNKNVFTSLFKFFRVMPGTAVVVVGNGQILEVLPEGSYHALAFPLMSRIDLYVVNVRERILDIETTKEFTLFYQTPDKTEIPVQVDINIAVSYQVVACERVALYVDKPVTNLYDTILESLRSIIAYAKYRDFQAGGQAGYMVRQQLEQRGVEQSLGIHVNNVQITALRGAEKLDAAIQDTFFIPQAAQNAATAELIQNRARLQIAMDTAVNQRDIARITDLTPQYAALFMDPERYRLLYGDKPQTDMLRLQMLTELVKSGMINMSAITGGANQAAIDGAIQAALGLPSSAPATALPPAPPSNRFHGVSALDRLQEEVTAMQSQGWNASLREDHGIYYVTVALRDAQGHTLDLYFICAPGYPAQAPEMFLELDHVQQQFAPDVLRHWTNQRSLIDLVEAVTVAYADI